MPRGPCSVHPEVLQSFHHEGSTTMCTHRGFSSPLRVWCLVCIFLYLPLFCIFRQMGFVWTCGFEFEGFGQRGILGILRQTVDSAAAKRSLSTFVPILFTTLSGDGCSIKLELKVKQVVNALQRVFLRSYLSQIQQQIQTQQQIQRYGETFTQRDTSRLVVTGPLLQYYSIRSRMILIAVQSGAHCEHYQAIIVLRATQSLPIATPA